MWSCPAESKQALAYSYSAMEASGRPANSSTRSSVIVKGGQGQPPVWPDMTPNTFPEMFSRARVPFLAGPYSRPPMQPFRGWNDNRLTYPSYSSAMHHSFMGSRSFYRGSGSSHYDQALMRVHQIPQTSPRHIFQPTLPERGERVRLAKQYVISLCATNNF